MSQDRCEYCGQEDRYGHNAICVMNTVEELRTENARLTSELDKAHRLLSQSIGWQRDAEIAKAKLTNAIRRIDGINDNPANYNAEINIVCDAILRPHLESKP